MLNEYPTKYFQKKHANKDFKLFTYLDNYLFKKNLRYNWHITFVSGVPYDNLIFAHIAK